MAQIVGQTLPGCVAGDQHLEILSVEGFHTAGRFLAYVDERVQWLWADYLFYAEKFNLKTVLDGARMDLHRSTIYGYLEVGRFFAPKDRHPKLSFTHHRDVRYILGPDATLKEARKWLQRAADGNWTAGKLREEMRLAAARGDRDPGPMRGQVTISDFIKVSRFAASVDPKEIPETQRAELRDATKPLWDFLCQIHRPSFQ